MRFTSLFRSRSRFRFRDRSRLIALLLALLGLMGVVNAQGVSPRAVVVNEFANIRLAPALGATVLDTVSAGFEFELITGRSADGEWLRVIYQGAEAWVNLAPLVVLSGDINGLPIADPRTIPFGGFDTPRAGPTQNVSQIVGRTLSGLRMRAGPSTAYPMMANIPPNEGLMISGRDIGGGWYQVIYSGTLGWVASRFVEVNTPIRIEDIPLGGIIADAPPTSDDIEDDYLTVLRLLRDRVNLAEQSLFEIRAAWTDAALTGRASCQPYPARPSNVSINTSVLAAFYATLNPLQSDFNVAMSNLRLTIDLFIEVCNQPGTGNPVGRATVQGALDVVNLVEEQFISLRRRLDGLIPDVDLGEGECLLSFRGGAEVLPVINLSTIYLDDFTPRDTSTGYCVDLVQGQTLRVQFLPIPDANVALFVAVSLLDNPSDFIALAQTSVGSEVNLGPIQIEESGRYVIIAADRLPETDNRNLPPRGEVAVYVQNVTGVSLIPSMRFDEETGAVVLDNDPDALPQDDVAGGQSQALASFAAQQSCPSPAFTCDQFFTCEEALGCLALGNFSLDADNDGIPCEATVCTPENLQPILDQLDGSGGTDPGDGTLE